MPSPATNVTVAETSSRSGGEPARASPPDRAIEKHAAWAAAINSSGLVFPSGCSAREAHVMPSGPKAPLPTLSMVPRPSVRDPLQVTFAVRSVDHHSPPSRFASTVTVALARRSAEIGQPASATSAARATASASAPGAIAVASMCDATIRWSPLSTWSIVMVHRTSMRSGGVPARASSLPSDVT